MDNTKDPIHRDGHCSPECPYLNPYEHPYYMVTAWCSRDETELTWYDYWVASCQTN